MNELKLSTPELQNIDKSKAQEIKNTFEPMVKMLSEFENSYNDLINKANQEINHDVTAKAKRLRLDIAKVRIQTGKLKDEQKKYIKLQDKAIMGVHNILVHAVTEKEDNLKKIEKHFEIQEQKRLEKLQSDRAEKLSKYVEDAHERDLSSMDDDVWNAYYEAKKKQYLDRIEAEKKAEAERIAKEKAEAEERERIRKENERLKKEAKERERQAKIEAKKQAEAEAKRKANEEAKRKKREEKERKEREAHEAELRKEREERQRIEREEKEKREKLEAEIKAKREAEEKARQEAEAKKQAELSKGDKDKVIDLIQDLESLKTKYKFKSKKNQKMYSEVSQLLDKTINHINQYDEV